MKTREDQLSGRQFYTSPLATEGGSPSEGGLADGPPDHIRTINSMGEELIELYTELSRLKAESQKTIRGLKDSIHEHIDADRINARTIQQLREQRDDARAIVKEMDRERTQNLEIEVRERQALKAELEKATKERDEALAKLKEVQPDVAYVMRYDEQKDEMLYEPPDEPDLCAKCNQPMSTDEGCEPTEDCHQCARDDRDALKAQLTAEITHSNKLAEFVDLVLHLKRPGLEKFAEPYDENRSQAIRLLSAHEQRRGEGCAINWFARIAAVSH